MIKVINHETGVELATVQLPLCLLIPGNVLELGNLIVKIKSVRVIFKPSQGVYDEIASKVAHVEIL